MSHWLGEVWIQIWDILIVLPLSLFYLKNRICLNRGVQVTGAAWRAAMRIVIGIGDLVQRTWDGRTDRILGGRTIRRSGDAMCGMHHARGDEKSEFLGWASKPRSTVCQWFGLKITRTVCQWFDLKTIGMIFSGLTLKLVATVSSGLASKLVASGFLVWALRPTATVWWFGPQNHHGGFLVWASKSSKLRFVGCVTKSTGGQRRGTRVEI
jgi:hypothetical protein